MHRELRVRDTYTDYITRFEMHALLRKGRSIDEEIAARKLALAQRSGAAGVGSGVILQAPANGSEGLSLRVIFDSRAWTGRSYDRPWNYSRRLSTRLIDRFVWWAKIAAKKLLCPHEWPLYRDSCALCHLTYEEDVDHSFRHFPRNVTVS